MSHLVIFDDVCEDGGDNVDAVGNVGGAGGTGVGGAAGAPGGTVTASNIVSGSTTGTLTLEQDAIGGIGGASNGNLSGAGGNATSNLTYTPSNPATNRSPYPITAEPKTAS